VYGALYRVYFCSMESYATDTNTNDLDPWFSPHPFWFLITLWRHSCLLVAATFSSSQVGLVFCSSLLIVLLNFVLGRLCPLLSPGTSQYNVCLVCAGKRLLSHVQASEFFCLLVCCAIHGLLSSSGCSRCWCDTRHFSFELEVSLSRVNYVTIMQ